MESSSADTVATEEGYQPIFFDPRGLKNLLLVDEMESLCPIMDMQVPPPPPDRPVMLAPCSGLRLLRPHSHCRNCAAEDWVFDSCPCLSGAQAQPAAGLRLPVRARQHGAVLPEARL